MSACGGGGSTTPDTLTLTLNADKLTGAAPLLVNFSAVVPGADSSVGYSWDFGGGNTEKGSASRAFTFTEAGDYPVTVTASRGEASQTQTVTVSVTAAPVVPGNQSPVAELSTSRTTGQAPLAVDFSANAVDPDGDALSYAWNFGDSTVLPEGAAAQSHTFAQAGAYEVAVTVTDGRGGVAQATVQIATTDPSAGEEPPAPPTPPTTAENQPPTVALTANKTSGAAPLTVSFDTQANDPEDDPLSYAWDFGNGETAKDNLSRTVTYTEPGSYRAVVAVSDGLVEKQASLQIEVAGNATEPPAGGAPTLELSASPTSGSAPLPVKFSAQVSAPSSASLSYLWDFGDGTISGEVSPAHTYREGGTYNASLTIGDRASGGRTRKEISIEVAAGAGEEPGDPDVPFYGEWAWSAETPSGKIYQGYLSVSQRTPDPEDFGDTFIEGGNGAWTYCPNGLEACGETTGVGYIDIVDYGDGEQFDITFGDRTSETIRLNAFDSDDRLGTELGGAPTFQGGGAWYADDGSSEEVSFTMVKIATEPAAATITTSTARRGKQ